MADTGTPSKIVVGVNGSPSSRSALTWALRQARLTHAELHTVMSTWTIPVNHGWTPVPERTEGSDWQVLAMRVMDEAIDAAVGHTEPDEIRRHVAQGHPARVLLAAAADAELLVVGSGADVPAGSPLSQLCQELVSRAPCPVVVVRGRPALIEGTGPSAREGGAAADPRSPASTTEPPAANGPPLRR